MVLEKLLLKRKYACCKAFGGFQAVELIMKRVGICKFCDGVFKLIIVDIEMPKLNGWQTMT
jgi:CheY-like chemotaxis protein